MKDNVRASEMYDHYRMSVGPGSIEQQGLHEDDDDVEH